MLLIFVSCFGHEDPTGMLLLSSTQCCNTFRLPHPTHDVALLGLAFAGGRTGRMMRAVRARAGRRHDRRWTIQRTPRGLCGTWLTPSMALGWESRHVPQLG